MRWLRWILVIPGACAAWYVAFVVGVLVVSGVSALCPPELIVSGGCTAPWIVRAERVVICASAGLAAALVVLASTLIAPAHRATVAVVAFAGGALVAIVLGIHGRAPAELITALVVGGVTMAWIRRSAWLRP